MRGGAEIEWRSWVLEVIWSHHRAGWLQGGSALQFHKLVSAHAVWADHATIAGWRWRGVSFFCEGVSFISGLEDNYIFQGMVPTPLSPWVSVSGVNNRSVVPQTVRGRQSVRLESKRRYNEGLFIITLSHAPVSCGSWPALWMFGSLGWLKLWDLLGWIWPSKRFFKWWNLRRYVRKFGCLDHKDWSNAYKLIT